MFGLGGSEMVLIGIVALIVIGPKDLPGLFRTMGEFTGKARRMASEFNRAMQSAADESGVGDIKKTLEAAAQPKKFGVEKIREATGMSSAAEAKALSPERQANKDRIDRAMADAARERQAREAEAQSRTEAADDLAEAADIPEDTK